MKIQNLSTQPISVFKERGWCTRAGLVGELFSVIVPNTEEEDEFTSVWGQKRLSSFYEI